MAGNGIIHFIKKHLSLTFLALSGKAQTDPGSDWDFITGKPEWTHYESKEIGLLAGMEVGLKTLAFSHWIDIEALILLHWMAIKNIR